MLKKCVIVMLLVGVANLAQAGRLPAMLDKATAAFKRAGLRASTAVTDKHKQFGKALATLGIAVVMLTSNAVVSAADETHQQTDDGHIVNIHDGYLRRSRLGGEVVLYNLGLGVGDTRTSYAEGLGLRPLAKSSVEIKLFDFGKSLSDDNFTVALTHQLFGFYESNGLGHVASPFNYTNFSVNAGISYHYFAESLGVAWQVDFDALHFLDNVISVGVSYFGYFAGADEYAHIFCLTTCIAFLE